MSSHLRDDHIYKISQEVGGSRFDFSQYLDMPILNSEVSVLETAHLDFPCQALSRVNKAAYMSNSESECEEHYSDGSSLSEELVSWVAMFNANLTAVNPLLKVLVKHGHSDLPTTRLLMGNTYASQIKRWTREE